MSVQSLDDVDPFDDIRTECEALITDESISKEVALGVVRLVHKMETRLVRVMHDQAVANSALIHDNKVLQLSHQQAASMASVTHDVSKHRTEIGALATRVDEIESALRATPRKR